MCVRSRALSRSRKGLWTWTRALSLTKKTIRRDRASVASSHNLTSPGLWVGSDSLAEFASRMKAKASSVLRSWKRRSNATIHPKIATRCARCAKWRSIPARSSPFPHGRGGQSTITHELTHGVPTLSRTMRFVTTETDHFNDGTTQTARPPFYGQPG